MSILVGRLLPLAVGQPVNNMSIDQMLLESVDAGGPPTLRFYQWSEPTLSLGYFQKLAERHTHAESRDIKCVRRATGGGAIIHHHELTYSIAVPVSDGGAGARVDLYQRTHQVIAEALSDFGIRAIPFRQTGVRFQDEASFLCFQRRTDEDLIVSGYKIAGSAQRRGRRAILQHGSLLLSASPQSPQLPGVVDLSSRSVTVEPLVTRISAGLTERLSIRWEIGELSRAESKRRDEIAAERFGASHWLSRR